MHIARTHINELLKLIRNNSNSKTDLTIQCNFYHIQTVSFRGNWQGDPKIYMELQRVKNKAKGSDPLDFKACKIIVIKIVR